MWNVLDLQGCSCFDLNHLCDYTNGFPDSKVLVLDVRLVKFIDHYDDLYEAEFVINSKIREDVPVNSKIRLLSSNNLGDCTIKFKSDFKIDSSYILAIVVEGEDGFQGYSGINFSDEAEDLLSSNPNIWRFYPMLCYFRSIKIESDLAIGWIKEDVFYCPLAEFYSKLPACNFDMQVIDSYYCDRPEYVIYPNPSNNGEIRIRSNLPINSFDLITVFDSVGRKISSPGITVISKREVKFDFGFSGIYFVQIECRNKLEVFKVIVL